MKKLVSFTENTDKTILKKIEELSLKNGMNKSRIMEDCLIYGYCLLYAEENEIDDIVISMKNRYGNIVDVNKIKSIILK